jgi:hypothetical protein
MAGTEDNNGFEGWGQELDDEYLQAEQNSIMQNQGLPIKEVI